jgi:hypothetical protein
MNRRPWHRWAGRLLAVAAGLALAVAPYPLTAVVGGTPQSPEQLMLAQIPLDRAADRASAAAGSPGSGLGEIAVSAETSSITVHWKGAIPPAVNAVIGAIRASGIQVNVRAALHTRQELEAAAQRVMSASAGYAGAGVDAVVLRPDGSGLDVAASGDGSAASARIASDAGVDVRLVPAMHPHPTWRLADYTPHWAGARITSDGVHPCTSGFPIVRNSDGRTFILTAAHCGGTRCSPTTTVVCWWAWYGYKSTDNGYKFGDVWNVTNSLDVQYIRSFTGPYTYDGGVAYGTDFAKQVVGSGSNHPGDWVCQSGGFTGIHCGLQVQYTTVVSLNGTNVTEWLACGNPYRSVCNSTGAGQGDSGGSVFSLGSQSGTVIAKGMQSYGFTTGYSCTNNNGETTTCYNAIGFVDIGQILSNYGARIMT